MAVALGDERLHEFIGGHPASVEELRLRYQRWEVGSPDPNESWLNWAVRRGDGHAMGWVQATVTSRGDHPQAAVAWVIGVDWQGRGYASEAARALVDWLQKQGIVGVTASIRPGNRASERVAKRTGLRPTSQLVDGERVWQLPPSE